jgi:hypothetical protein
MSEPRDPAPAVAASPRDEDEDQSVVIGILAAPGLTYELALELAHDLPAALRERFAEVDWEVEVKLEPRASASHDDVDLVELARERMLAAGWDLVICLTDLPLRVDRRPVTAYASPTHGIGVVSVPALGAVDLGNRVLKAALRLLEGLLGESPGGGVTSVRGRESRNRVRARLYELASPVGRADPQEDRTVRFVTAVVRGNIRLLVGMVRANRPWRLAAGLSRALVGALGVDLFGLVSPGVWRIADGISWPRLLAFGLVSLLLTCVSLIVGHGLWEHSGAARRARERVVLFNLATCLTAVLGVVSLYLALVAFNALAAGLLLTPGVLRRELGHGVGIGDYAALVWLVSSLATLGGALGAALENHRAVRAAAYGRHADEHAHAEAQRV